MATARCECGHTWDDHRAPEPGAGPSSCLLCSCSLYKFSESQSFGTPPPPKYILATKADDFDRAVVLVDIATGEASINLKATDTEIRLALKTCAIQLCKLNRILSEFGLPAQ